MRAFHFEAAIRDRRRLCCLAVSDLIGGYLFSGSCRAHSIIPGSGAPHQFVQTPHGSIQTIRRALADKAVACHGEHLSFQLWHRLAVPHLALFVKGGGGLCARNFSPARRHLTVGIY
jgi:hypothetical protein